MEFVDLVDLIYKRIGYGYLGLPDYQPETPIADDSITQEIRTHCESAHYHRRTHRYQQAKKILSAIDSILLKKAQLAESALRFSDDFIVDSIDIGHQVKLINVMYAIRKQLDKEMKIGGGSMLAYALTSIISAACQQHEIRFALTLQRDRFVFQKLSGRVQRFIEAYLSMPGIATQKQQAARRIQFETTQLQHINTMTGTQKQIELLKMLFDTLDFLRSKTQTEAISLSSACKAEWASQSRKQHLQQARNALPTLKSLSYVQTNYQHQQFSDCFSAWCSHPSVVIQLRDGKDGLFNMADLLSAHTQFVEGIDADVQSLFSVQPCVLQADCVAFLSQPKGSKLTRFIQQMITQISSGAPYSEALSHNIGPILSARMMKMSKARTTDPWRVQAGLPIQSVEEAGALTSCF